MVKRETERRTDISGLVGQAEGLGLCYMQQRI